MRLGERRVRLYADKHLENIGSMFSTLYREELLTDCTLYCRDGAVRAHKLVLAASSAYFRRIFQDNGDRHAIFVMYGVSAGPLRHLLELIYKGTIDVPGDTFSSVFDLAEELQVAGILADGASTEKCNGYGRDTRYKGQKRVAVNFTADETESLPVKILKNNRRSSSASEKEDISDKITDIACPSNDENSDLDISISHVGNDCVEEKFVGHQVDEQSTLSVWARKERKFKCDICPSSFKRASHLTRHQLVHTGERPFACNQCEKAFSRHDKLKHHIIKTHELIQLNDALPPDSLYTIGHVDILTPEQTMVESTEPIVQNAPAQPVPQKKGRGRPRKYPIVPPPLVKRPRGRPRLNPIVPPEPAPKREVFDISNMPYGDLEYLTKSINENNDERGMMEPLVEIKTDSVGKSDEQKEQSSSTFLENIGLFENSAIAKIGECTISVASNSVAVLSKEEGEKV